VTVLGANPPARIGYLFDTWNTAADGNGASYDPSDTYVPAGSVAAYEGAGGWGDYDAQIDQEP
jgi:hypothetical protein